MGTRKKARPASPGSPPGASVRATTPAPAPTGFFARLARFFAGDGLAALPSGALVVDVRTRAEFGQGRFPGALNIPHDEIARRHGELGPDRARPIVVYCASGARSRVAADALRRLGFGNVHNGRTLQAMRRLAKPR